MDRRIDVSIILGVYNAEPYIRRCMDSLVAQTLADIEIIAVDDGSEDGSADIVRDYASQDDRIRVLVHAGNRGPGAARNTGLEAARGTCIRFIDNDDCVPPGATELLFEVHRRMGSDVVRGRVDRIRDGEVEPIPWMPPLDEAFNVPFANNRNLWAGYGAVGAYLFDQPFVGRNDLRFSEDINVGEDAVWNARCLTLASSVSVINACVYHYDDQTVNSLMRPIAPKPAHYLHEARTHLAVASILLASCRLAFVMYCTKHLAYRRKRMADAVQRFAASDVMAVIEMYRRLYRLAPPSLVFEFAQARGIRSGLDAADFQDFARLMTEASASEVYGALGEAAPEPGK